MIRNLFVITAAGLVLAVGSFAGAVALGGADIRANGGTWSLENDRHGNSRFVRGGGGEATGPITTRTVAWTGGDTLEIEVPMNVVYVQGPASTVVITGPQAAVERVTIEGGRISLNDDGLQERVTFSFRDGIHAWSESERVTVTVTAPGVRRFDLEGSADLSIEGFDQDTLALDISGSGEVTAKGRTRALTLDISGSGEALLADLVTTDAEVNVSGSGDARIAPTGAASVSISGSGDVDLSTRPASLRSDISGSGDIDELG